MVFFFKGKKKKEEREFFILGFGSNFLLNTHSLLMLKETLSGYCNGSLPSNVREKNHLQSVEIRSHIISIKF
jgi:hypothetical protein